MHPLLKKIKTLYQSGFFDIFGATLLNSVVSFLYGIFLVRMLSKTDFGTFSYVQNILNFGLMFCTLGGGVGMLQFCSEAIDEKKKYAYCRLALKMGVLGSVLIPFLMLAYTKVDHAAIDRLTFYMAECAFLPLLYFIKDWATINLRWQFKNREYGIVMNVHSVLNALLAITGAALFGIQGVFLGIYLAYGVSGACALYFLRNTSLPALKPKESSAQKKLEKKESRSFVQYSLTMILVNALISVLFTIDLFVIGNIVQDTEQIAMYKAASTIPFALNMIPNAVMTFAYPHIAMHKEEPQWMKRQIRRLYLANAALNGLIGAGLYVCAPVVISILFGTAYEGIEPIFRVLILSYVVSACLRTPSANLLAALKMSKTALVVSALTVGVSLCMGICLVGAYGIQGAAYSSVFTFGIVGVLSFAIICYIIYRKK